MGIDTILKRQNLIFPTSLVRVGSGDQVHQKTHFPKMRSLAGSLDDGVLADAILIRTYFYVIGCWCI